MRNCQSPVLMSLHKKMSSSKCWMNQQKDLIVVWLWIILGRGKIQNTNFGLVTTQRAPINDLLPSVLITMITFTRVCYIQLQINQQGANIRKLIIQHLLPGRRTWPGGGSAKQQYIKVFASSSRHGGQKG